MTVDQIINRARMLARVSDLSSSEEDCVELLNMGIEDIAHQVGGIHRRVVTKGQALYSLPPGAFIQADGSITLIITQTGLSDVSGQEVATSFNLLNTGYILSYNEWDLSFNLTFPNEDEHTVEQVKGFCFTSYLFGRNEISSNGTDTITGLATEEFKFGVKIDEVFTDIQRVWFAGRELLQLNLEPESRRGMPSNFSVRDDFIILTPAPFENEIVVLEYLGTPSKIQMLEIESEYPLVDTSEAVFKPGPLNVPPALHNLLIYFLASKLAAQEHEYGVSDRMLALYNRDIGRYVVEKANANPDIGFGILY